MLITLDEALDHLPGLDKMRTLELLRLTRQKVTEGVPQTMLRNVRVTRADMKQMYIWNEKRVPHISPRGTRFLVFLYNNLELPLIDGADVSQVSAALSNYADKQYELESETRAQQNADSPE
jgi:hypothetical protein